MEQGVARKERRDRSRRSALVRYAAPALPAFLLAAPLPAQAPYVESVAQQLKWRVEHLREAGTLRIGTEVVQPRALTLEAYERRGFQPLWTDPLSFESVLRALADLHRDGLDPEDYHLSALRRAASRRADAASPGAPAPRLGASAAAELDLLSTDALVRAAEDVRFGKVEGRGPSDTDAPWLFGGVGAVDSLVEVATSGRAYDALETLRPRHFVYRGLVDALAGLRQIEAAGGWGWIPDGPALGLGSVDPRVPALARRLALQGDLTDGADSSRHPVDATLVDTAVEEAIRRFQHRHGLNEDGVVAGRTLEALNVPVERRIEQVRVNLERARWVARALPDTFVAVNVAGAKVYLLHGDSVAFETRGIVGTDYTRTPVFSAPMLYVDLNPTWTVPPSAVDEILALVRADSSYLARQGMRVLNRAGEPVDPSGIDFTRYTAADFPYVFRQDPGPANALGRIKLMFPNEHSVYLHDTPTRHLFGEEERLYSHGCIRVQDPLGLAELVIGEPERWDRAALQAAIDTGRTRTIRLAQPVAVFVLYWTASVDLHGELHFYRDVYDRDASILAELDGAGTNGGAGR